MSKYMAIVSVKDIVYDNNRKIQNTNNEYLQT